MKALGFQPMSKHSADLTIEHPELDEVIQVTAVFNFWKGSRGTYYEPPEYDDVELLEVVYNGEDISHLLSSIGVENIESKILAIPVDTSDEDMYNERYYD